MNGSLPQIRKVIKADNTTHFSAEAVKEEIRHVYIAITRLILFSPSAFYFITQNLETLFPGFPRKLRGIRKHVRHFKIFSREKDERNDLSIREKRIPKFNMRIS